MLEQWDDIPKDLKCFRLTLNINGKKFESEWQITGEVLAEAKAHIAKEMLKDRIAEMVHKSQLPIECYDDRVWMQATVDGTNHSVSTKLKEIFDPYKLANPAWANDDPGLDKYRSTLEWQLVWKIVAAYSGEYKHSWDKYTYTHHIHTSYLTGDTLDYNNMSYSTIMGKPEEYVSFPDTKWFATGGTIEIYENPSAGIYYGTTTNSDSVPAFLEQYFPGVLNERVSMPCPCHFNMKQLLRSAIIHLNDEHHPLRARNGDVWTRERIAEWMRTLDIDMTIKEPTKND